MFPCLIASDPSVPRSVRDRDLDRRADIRNAGLVENDRHRGANDCPPPIIRIADGADLGRTLALHLLEGETGAVIAAGTGQAPIRKDRGEEKTGLVRDIPLDPGREIDLDDNVRFVYPVAEPAPRPAGLVRRGLAEIRPSPAARSPAGACVLAASGRPQPLLIMIARKAVRTRKIFFFIIFFLIIFREPKF